MRRAATSLRGAIGWTALGTLLPGLGFLGARRRRTALAIFLPVLAVVAAVTLLGVFAPARLASLAVRPSALRTAAWGIVVLALLWVGTVVATYLAVRPAVLSRARRAVGAAAVLLLCLAVAAPLMLVARYATDEAGLVDSIFGRNSSRSQTAPSVGSGSSAEQVFAGKDRVNVLLVGLDDSGARNYTAKNAEDTDSMMVASIDVHTGNTVLIQVPRNMEHAVFPAGSALAKAYPNGYVSPDEADNSMTNSIWANVPAVHPELFKNTDNPNADALKLALQGSLGIPIDYFLALDIDGMQELIDAMGGVTVNVNYPYAIGGDTTIGDSSVKGYLTVGANEHLDGYHALWYARSRYNDPAGDFGRMARQSCLIHAVSQQADPATLLVHFEAIAAAGKKMVQTDIPQSVLPAFVDLALKLKGATLSRLLFVNGKDGFVSADPDYAVVRKRVAAALAASSASASPTPTPTAATSAQSHPSVASTSAASAATSSPAASAGSSDSADPSQSDDANLTDACGYHPISVASASATATASASR